MKIALKIILLSIVLLILNIKNISYAQPIKTFPKVEVPNENSEASNKYAVIANFVKGKTEVKTFGDVNWEHLKDDDGKPIINISNPPISQKGKFGVIYTNVGTFEGKSLDLKITINNWNKFSKNKASITFEEYSIGHLQGGYNWVDQNWQYVDHETGNPANISGSYMTFNDLDAMQYVQFSKQTTKEIDKMYVSNDTWVDASMHNKGELRIGEIAGKEATRNDRYAMVTALFSGNSIQFKWGKIYEEKEAGNSWSWEKGSNYFGFSGEKPVKTEVLKPTKLIIQNDNKTTKANEIKTKNGIIRYDIIHSVPSEYAEFFYKSYSLKDDLIKNLEIVGTPQIYNESDENVTDKFINKSTESNINFQATDSTLKDSSFYGHTYHLRFDAKVKNNSNLSESIDDDDSFFIKNIGYIEKDGKVIKTNVVLTKFKPLNNNIHKSIIDNNQEVEEKKVRVDELYKYRIKGTVGNDETIQNFAIVDDGEDVLSFENAKVFDAQHEDITNQGTLTIDKEKNIVKWVPTDISNIYGKTYIMEIDSKIKPKADLKAYKHDERYIIPNTGRFEINNNKIYTNTVNVYTIPISNSIHKSILENGKEIEEKKVRVDELYKYRIKGTVGNSETIHDFAIVDDGEDVLSFENTKVFDENHVDITNQGTLTINKEKNIVKWVPNDISNIYGKTYIMEIDSKIKKSVKLKNYKNKKRYIIPNTAQFIINNKVVKSNTVNVFTVFKPNKPININQIQQNINDKHKIKNSNNEISDSYNDITINIKRIKHFVNNLNLMNNTSSNLNSKDKENSIQSSLQQNRSIDIRDNSINKQLSNIDKKTKDEPIDILPKTGLNNNLTIVVLGSLLILFSFAHVFILLYRRER